MAASASNKEMASRKVDQKRLCLPPESDARSLPDGSVGGSTHPVPCGTSHPSVAPTHPQTPSVREAITREGLPTPQIAPATALTDHAEHAAGQSASVGRGNQSVIASRGGSGAQQAFPAATNLCQTSVTANPVKLERKALTGVCLTTPSGDRVKIKFKF